MQPLRVLAVLAIAGLATGCREVIIERSDGGEADDQGGGAGLDPFPAAISVGQATAGTGGASGSGFPSSAETSSGPAQGAGGFEPAPCDKFCEAAGPCFGNCTAVCAGYQQPPCEPEGAAIVACLSENFDADTCEAVGCEAETSNLLACRATVPAECTNVGCGGGDDFCSCTGECDGGQQKAICNVESSEAVCTCYLNSMAATCQGPALGDPAAGDTVDCDLEIGCCASIFGAP